MNHLLIIVFVAVTVNGQDKILEPLENLAIVTGRLQKALNDIQEYKNQSISLIKRYVGDLEISQLQAINSAVDQVVNDTRNNITAVKCEGQNADRCYDLIRDQLADALEIAIYDLNRCVEDEESPITDLANDINATVLAGKTFLLRLNYIPTPCRNEDRVQLCIARKLPRFNLDVHSFESKIQEFKTKGESLTIIESVQRCFLRPKTAFDSAVLAAKSLVVHCIQNACSGECT